MKIEVRRVEKGRQEVRMKMERAGCATALLVMRCLHSCVSTLFSQKEMRGRESKPKRGLTIHSHLKRVTLEET